MEPSSLRNIKFKNCCVLVERLPDEDLERYLQTKPCNDSVTTSNNKAERQNGTTPIHLQLKTCNDSVTTSNNKAEMQNEITPEFSVRYGTDAYVWEFQRYLFKLQDRKERCIVLKELKKKGIKQDLLIRNERGDYKINEELVNWIMKRQCNGLPLRLNWNSLSEATKKLQVEIEEIRKHETGNGENGGGCWRSPRSMLNKLFRIFDFS
ncbi:hypothetical protein AVEN_53238-1 [Araneus ventricosus]|uniref:Uncharacterized protein n=1 Tax=Araneus ventricosus TaxID=182803 RepID=A0A4Y2AB41_ARAVE|nr:hypothetical protein AVEN_53238-1 [Araneus ventricosus]